MNGNIEESIDINGIKIKGKCIEKFLPGDLEAYDSKYEIQQYDYYKAYSKNHL